MKKALWILIPVFVLLIVIFFSFAFKSKPDDNNNVSYDNSAFSKTPTAEASASPVTATAQTKMKKTYSQPPKQLSAGEIDGKKARIQTKYGDIVIKLSSEAPLAASNFITLSKDGFYDGLTFHRRVEGFVIQGGDPTGTGSGDPGYKFKDEPVKREYKRGVVAMANSGPDTNGSQFFVMLADTSLPPLYTIFGDVIEGMDVVDKIKVGDVMTKVVIE